MTAPPSRTVAVERANRRVAWLVALGGMLSIAGQALPDLVAQASLFPLWWNGAGVVAMLALVVLAAAGLWLPQSVLRVLWWAVPGLVVALQLLSYAVYAGPGEGIAPWVWRLEPAALTLLVFVTRPAFAVGATIFAGGSVAISAWVFVGSVPEVVAWNTPFHMSEIGFVVIFLGIRNRVALLRESEEASRIAAEESAVRTAEARRQAAHARLVHDEVLSVLNAARMFSGPPPEVLREEAGTALRALEAGPETSPPGEDRPVPASIAAERLRDRLQALIAGVDIVADRGSLPAGVLDAVIAAALEAVRNARRHADAERITAVARLSGGGVRVIVADDGVGFDPARVSPGRRGVVDSIAGRLADVGGEARVESSRGAGTEVILSWHPVS